MMLVRRQITISTSGHSYLSTGLSEGGAFYRELTQLRDYPRDYPLGTVIDLVTRIRIY